MKRVLSVALGVTLMAVAAAFLGAGCGPKLHTVECKVSLDDQAVEGATVVFVPQDEEQAKKETPSGQTDASGKAVMQTGSKPGVPPGKYKVVVTKIPKLEGIDTGGSSDRPGDATKMMQQAVNQGAIKTNQRPGAGPAGGGPSKNQLPDKYSKAETTDLSVEVPTSGVVPLNLKK